MYVTILGQTFRPGVIVCLKSPSDNDFPVFGEVVQVLVPNELKFLLVRELDTTFYYAHFNAYNVTKSSNYALVDIGSLAIHDVFHLYKSSSLLFVVVRSCNHVELCV